MLSIVFMVLCMVIGIAIPVVLAVYIRKKYHADMLAFWMGVLVMFLFAFVLEQIVHAIVFSSAVGQTIQNNMWLKALYGGIMAGLFEESGRFVAMHFVLKKRACDPHNALMYGAGHGGFEAFVILSIGMINYLIYAICINAGATELLLAPLDAVSRQTLQQAFDSLVNMSPFLLLLSPLERFAAVIAQIALSVLVWFAATQNGQIRWYFVAIFLHFLLDASAVTLSGLGVPTLLIEVVIWILAIVFALLARYVWKQNGIGDGSDGSDGNSTP